MSAIIRVNDPDTGSNEIWIEKPFLTIGSGPNCDVPIKSSNGGEVASVRYNEGRYLIFNKADDNLLVDGAAVARGTSARWAPGKTVEFSSGAELELVVQGDPAPVKRTKVTTYVPPVSKQVDKETDDADGEEEKAEVKPVKKSKLNVEIIQAFVILVCVAGCIAILTLSNQQDQGGQGHGSTKADFAKLVAAGAEPASNEQPAEFQKKQALIRQLQSAEFSARRGDFALAQAKYDRLKRYLDQQQYVFKVTPSKAAEGADKTSEKQADKATEPADKLLAGAEFESTLRAFVESQLAKLPAK